MKYIDFAENERLSTIVLGMMRISELSEDEVEGLVEGALSIGINTFDLADIYGMASVSSSLVRSSNVVRIFGTRCGSSPSVGFAKMVLPILIFPKIIFWIPLMASSSVCRLSV